MTEEFGANLGSSYMVCEYATGSSYSRSPGDRCIDCGAAVTKAAESYAGLEIVCVECHFDRRERTGYKEMS